MEHQIFIVDLAKGIYRCSMCFRTGSLKDFDDDCDQGDSATNKDLETDPLAKSTPFGIMGIDLSEDIIGYGDLG